MIERRSFCGSVLLALTIASQPLGAQTVSEVKSDEEVIYDTGSVSDFEGYFDTTPVFPPATIYGITNAGGLDWFRGDGALQPSSTRRWTGPEEVGNGWGGFKAVFPAGGNALFAVDQGGALWLYRHQGTDIGSKAWAPAVKVSDGFGAYARLFGGGEGVIYAVRSDGILDWYRVEHTSQTAAGALVGPVPVGRGWGGFKHVFSGGSGVIYAVQEDGGLHLYRHHGYLTGAEDWSASLRIDSGWDTFRVLFSVGNGVIYAIRDDGAVLWYRHSKDGPVTPPGSSVREPGLERVEASGSSPGHSGSSPERDRVGVTPGYSAAVNRDRLPATPAVFAERWEGPFEVRTGWSDYRILTALLPGTPSVVR